MRAALALESDDSKRLEIDKEKAKSLYTISERIESAEKKLKNNKVNYSIYTSILDWKKDIKPWVKRDDYSYSFDKNSASQKWFEESQDSKDKRAMFDFSASHLTESGFNNLCSDFLEYAIPIASDYTRKLSTKISPDTYSDMLRDYNRFDRRHES